ncbi:MAG: N-acetyltransferase [Candidatus Lokiarchaeota archaeon]|nr:N-acetyltransferase [Candidatus Lokiarchaeota archaeon]
MVDVKLGKNVKIFSFVNLYGCEIGDGSQIGCFVEIQKNSVIGKNVKISTHSFICEGVEISDNVFVGHNVTFINDKYPRATRADGKKKEENDWILSKTYVGKGASIGSGSIVLGGISIGDYAMIGAGSVVTKDVSPHTIVIGNPARFLRKIEE